MSSYVDELDCRAPALFWGPGTTYTGEYRPEEYADGEIYRSMDGTVLSAPKILPARINYTVTQRRQHDGSRIKAEITVPMKDVADFETSLKNRIRQA